MILIVYFFSRTRFHGLGKMSFNFKKVKFFRQLDVTLAAFFRLVV